ncbi:MAG: GGDEF domain-containing protein [Candidatus Doudnabacteria bacterium]|nr:GGDEF domain-containing protein [Candidatus Doudnabacteria bacterium]
MEMGISRQTQGSDGEQLPATVPDSQERRAALKIWIQQNLPAELVESTNNMVSYTLDRQRQDIEDSKDAAVRAIQEGMRVRVARLLEQLAERDVTTRQIVTYFEGIVADLTEKGKRDPKTKLYNLDWFMERLESFLAVEKRVRWCAVGIVDINSFKWYNDTLGHQTGDRIIAQVARTLSEQIRSGDYLAQERPEDKDVHARFGGDEFCFMIPDMPDSQNGVEIANRFKAAVEGYDWPREDERLVQKPVKVDVGIICLRLGPIEERRGVARQLAAKLINEADVLMYKAKGAESKVSGSRCVTVANGDLVDIHCVDGDSQ